MANSIPRPLVRTNQATVVGAVALALWWQQPLLLSGLMLVLLSGLLGGPRYNLIFRLGRLWSAERLAQAPAEDAVVQRFNQTLAVTMLGAAQIAFLAGLPLVGWSLAVAVAVAAALALAGFCVGCYLYPTVRVLLYRLQRLT